MMSIFLLVVAVLMTDGVMKGPSGELVGVFDNEKSCMEVKAEIEASVAKNKADGTIPPNFLGWQFECVKINVSTGES